MNTQEIINRLREVNDSAFAQIFMGTLNKRETLFTLAANILEKQQSSNTVKDLCRIYDRQEERIKELEKLCFYSGEVVTANPIVPSMKVGTLADREYIKKLERDIKAYEETNTKSQKTIAALKLELEAQ